MKQSRALIVVGGSAVILGAGVVAAPDTVPTLDLGLELPPTDDAPEPEPTATRTPEPTAVQTPEPAPEPEGFSGTFTGPAISNIRGTYQLAIVVEAGVVVDVVFLEAGTNAPQSVNINASALPILEERILEARHWDVEYVSGASFTSPAMVESAQGAFEDAGLV